MTEIEPVSVASKLQIKAGQSVAVLHLPPGVELELSTELTTANDPTVA